MTDDGYGRWMEKGGFEDCLTTTTRMEWNGMECNNYIPSLYNINFIQCILHHIGLFLIRMDCLLYYYCCTSLSPPLLASKTKRYLARYY